MTNEFKKAIEAGLKERAGADPLFAKNLEKKGKTIEGCLAYILNTVKKSRREGFTDDEVFNMAAHYYDEDDLENKPAPQCRVVTNKSAELSADEIAALKEQARLQVIEEEKQRLQSRRSKPAASSKVQQASLF